MSDREQLVVSFSGGRSSAMMARLIQTSPLYSHYEKHYVYANTGREREETLKFIHECDTRWELGVVWVEAVVIPERGTASKHRIVTYETAVRNTDPATPDHPFIAVVEKYGLPNNQFSHCTRELKENPIKSYLKSIGVEQYTTALGMRADERGRTTEKEGIIYPLKELKITEPVVRTFWDRQDFDLGLKDYEGNCDLCFKKSLRKRLTVLRLTPDVAAFWASLEGKRTSIRGEFSTVFDRNGLSVSDLVEMSKDPMLEMAVDKHDARLAEEAKNPFLFPMVNEIDWDFETHCHCKSS